MKRHQLLLMLFFLNITGLEVTSANVEQVPKDLVLQTSRPRVSQIEALLRFWKSRGVRPEFPPQESLTKFVTNSRPQIASLTFNYPVWYSLIEKGAPDMIATFEKAFPGATWVFIGRDMEPISDVFEAFYRSIGQPHRVKRLGMSSDSIKQITSEAVLGLVKGFGFDMHSSTSPYILIDSVSKGGGRQGRLVLKSVYQAAVDKGLSLSYIIQKFNMIAMQTFNTSLPPFNIKDIEKNMKELVALSQTNPDVFLKGQQKLFVYSGYAKKKGFRATFELTNEAGYVHWIGSWNQSFKEVHLNPDGTAQAQIGEAQPEEIRRAYVTYQTALVSLAESESFQKQVFSAAQTMGYEFSVNADLQSSAPLEKLKSELLKARTYEDLIETQKRFEVYNLGRESALEAEENYLSAFSKIENKELNASLLRVLFSHFEELLNESQVKHLILKQMMVFTENPKTTTQNLQAMIEFFSQESSPLKAKKYDLFSSILELMGQENIFYQVLFESSGENLRPSQNLIEILALVEKFSTPESFSSFFVHLMKQAPTLSEKEQILKFLVQKLPASLIESQIESVLTHAEPEGRKNLAAIFSALPLSQEARLTLESIDLKDIQSASEFMNRQRQIFSSAPDEIKTKVMRSILSHFFTLSPQVEQIKELMQSFPNLHDEIIVQALRTFSSRADYKKLKLPLFFRSREVKEAIREFEARTGHSRWKRFFFP